jgi:hypothetical protein
MYSVLYSYAVEPQDGNADGQDLRRIIHAERFTVFRAEVISLEVEELIQKGFSGNRITSGVNIISKNTRAVLSTR